MRPRLVARLALSALCAWPAASARADAPAVPPDEDFLEYLGSWDGDDEDWLVAAGTPEATPPSSQPGTKTDQGGGRASRPPREQER